MSLPGQTNVRALKPKRSIGKIILAVIGGVLLFVAAIMALVFWLTGDIAKTGHDFFARLRAGDAKGAYELTTPGFKSSATFAQFEAYIREQGLAKAEEPSWSNRSIEGSGETATGTLKGTIKTGGGEARPIELKLGKVNGEWRVRNLDFAAAGLSTGIALPGESDLIRLTHEANLVFAGALRAKSMKAFHEHISERFRAQYSVADLDKSFGDFINQGIDLTAIEKFRPAFADPAKTGEGGSFSISGVYETRPSRVLFDHVYVREGMGWKLISYNIRVRKAD